MSTFARLSSNLSVSPQITTDNVASAKANGFRMIINNRPDGESPDQPTSEEIGEAARANGLAYQYIPIASGNISAESVEAMRAALAEANGPVLAYCRTGTRSSLLWALTQASEGVSTNEISAALASAGYDARPVMGALEKLAQDQS